MASTNGTDHKKMYWNGGRNKAIRFYFYSQRGLALFNEFRYLFMLIFGIYVVLKLTNPVWLVGMFIVSCPLLVALGWIQVHHVAKVTDWLNIEFSTYWGRYGFDLQERTVQALEGIEKKIDKIGEAKIYWSAGTGGTHFDPMVEVKTYDEHH